jgi:hypothetical protein
MQQKGLCGKNGVLPLFGLILYRYLLFRPANVLNISFFFGLWYNSCAKLQMGISKTEAQ